MDFNEKEEDEHEPREEQQTIWEKNKSDQIICVCGVGVCVLCLS